VKLRRFGGFLVPPNPTITWSIHAAAYGERARSARWKPQLKGGLNLIAAD
jgi:hypothetical protein